MYDDIDEKKVIEEKIVKGLYITYSLIEKYFYEIFGIKMDSNIPNIYSTYANKDGEVTVLYTFAAKYDEDFKNKVDIKLKRIHKTFFDNCEIDTIKYDYFGQNKKTIVIGRSDHGWEKTLVIDFGSELLEGYENDFESIYDEFSKYRAFLRLIHIILYTSFEINYDFNIIENKSYIIYTTDFLDDNFIQQEIYSIIDKIYANEISHKSAFYVNVFFHHLLYDLSSAKYESGYNKGYMLIAKPKDNDDLITKFVNPVRTMNKIEDYLGYCKKVSHIRKLLELTDEKYALIYNGEYFLGIDKIDKYKDDAYLKIKFRNDNTFLISENMYLEEIGGYKEESIIKVKDRKILLPKLKLDEKLFLEKLSKLNFYNDIINEKENELCEIVSHISEYTKGTIIVLTAPENAKKEAERLKDCCTLINPINLIEEYNKGNKGLIVRLTSIDGAIILDTNGTCHAIGVILDGQYVKGGSSARGARFNSCNTYAKSKEPFEYLCITLSEDGHVNYFMSEDE